MKAFKGCTNPDCKVYKKTHYKKDDEFCVKCGHSLSFVCAGCWKVMEDNKKRFCTICEAEKEQKKEQTAEKVQNGVVKITAFAGMVGAVGTNFDKIANGAQKAVGAGAKIIKIVKR